VKQLPVVIALKPMSQDSLAHPINGINEEDVRKNVESVQSMKDGDDAPLVSYAHRYVAVRESRLGGNGLFATGIIKEGEVVSWEHGDVYEGLSDYRPGNKILTHDQIQERWPAQEDYERFMGWFYQIGDDVFVGPLCEENVVITTYQNHSCDPNTWWYDDFTLIARRDIHPDEEITFDYGTSESYPNPDMPKCLCGTAVCRGIVTPEDYLREDMQERYGNHFVGYLLKRINKIKEEKKEKEMEKEMAKEIENDFKLEKVAYDYPRDQTIEFFEATS